jgi:TPR repeat protein
MEVILLLFIICLIFLVMLLKPLIDEKREASKMIKDYRELFRQTKQSAENGNIKKIYLLSYFYQEGIGVEQDIEKSFYWYKTAKEKEDIELNEELEKIYEQYLTESFSNFT